MKTSRDPLAVDVDVDETPQKEPENVGTPSSTTQEKDDTAGSAHRPSKRVKKDDGAADPLVQAVQLGSQTLANAIKDVAATKTMPPGLFEAVDSLPGFEIEHKSKYYSYMLNHPNIAHGFMNVPLPYKVSMITDFINNM